MSHNPNVPQSWFHYEWPLPEVPNAPVPSKADYSPQNLAPIIESFAQILGTHYMALTFVYENNTHKDKNDDIFVQHPNDKTYLRDYLNDHKDKSDALLRYEIAAKKSSRLALFERESPAKIKYFQKPK
jgi:hypothetical protein